MQSKIDFSGRVAVITGAGGGLGKEYALFLAKNGASVVVNDLGGSVHGTGASSKPADLVVDQIRSLGGSAVADYHNVSKDGDKIIKNAIDTFGRVDILINNAGILRDKSFQKMSDDEWNLVHDVHLGGAFVVTKAAWEYFVRQGFGRIIMTISAAGLYGNVGQCNYSSAKMGLYGLGKTLAIEGRKRNIRCNIIAPVAGTRITETVLPEDIIKMINPAYVAPFVVSLCHESCSLNGEVFEIGAGYVSLVKLQASKGNVLGNKSLKDSIVDSQNFTEPIFIQNALDFFKEDLDIPNIDKAPIIAYAQNMRGKVAVITGAARGLGRSYAIQLAKCGCHLVLIDMALDDSGKPLVETVKQELSKWDVKVKTISKSIIEHAKDIVESVISEFSRIDILINNAGILRDKSFANISVAEWNAVLNVHLNGTYMMIKAFLPHFTNQKSGKIINVSSPACLTGNYGQANYCAAKAGIWGFTRSLSQELKKNGVDVGCIAPLAFTDMTKNVFNSKQAKSYTVDLVSPFVVEMCTSDIKLRGDLFVIGGGLVRCIRNVRSELVPLPASLTPEKIVETMKSLASKSYSHPNNAQIAFTSFIGNIVPPEPVENRTYKSIELPVESLDADRIIAYHLSIGFTEKDYDFVYENSSGFRPFLTFSNVLIYKLFAIFDFSAFLENFNLINLLHMSQESEQISYIHANSKIYSKGRVEACIGTSKGAIMKFVIESYTDQEKTKLAYRNVALIFVKNSKPKEEFGKKYDILPSRIVLQNSKLHNQQVAVPEIQAALFRLSGDKNPLHIDPKFASIAGFEKPILHGLCTFGITARILKLFSGGKSIQSVSGRFLSHVFPGDIIQIAADIKDYEFAYQTKVGERIVLEGRGKLMQEGSMPSIDSNIVRPSNIIDVFREKISQLSDSTVKVLSNKLNAIIKFSFEGVRQIFLVAKDDKLQVTAEFKGKEDVVVKISESNFLKLINGKSSGKTLYMKGEMKVSGDMSKMMNLDQFTQDLAKKTTNSKL